MICALVEEISYLVTILRTHASSLKSSDALLQKYEIQYSLILESIRYPNEVFNET